MSRPKDGGEAFPSVAEGGNDSGLHAEFNRGMSLRDYLAGQALVGLAQAFAGHDVTGSAVSAYRLADAMIAEREKEVTS